VTHGGHGKSRGLYFFFYGKGNENQKLGRGYFVHHRTVLAVQRAEFVSNRLSYIVLRGHWCNIIVLIVHVPSEEESDDSTDSFYDKSEQVFFIIFLSTIGRFFQEILMLN